MRVLHLVKTSVGATWALRQMRELVRMGVEVHVALPTGGPLVAQYQAAGICIHPVQLDLLGGNPARALGKLRALRDLVSQVQPDLIHSHFVGTTLTMRLALGRHSSIPRVFQVPGPLHLEQPLSRNVEILTASACDYWIGSCQWTCARYRRSGIANTRVFLSYYGIDLANFQRGEPGKLRQELRISPTAPLVGMVAYMYAPKRYLGQTRGLKGHEDLIDALALGLKSNPNLRGVFIGGAWNHADAYENQIKKYAQAKCGDRVVFLGTCADVSTLYPDLDVVVHPSHSENVGGAAESLLLAVPTIATDVGGLPDLVKPGETGWLVPPRDPSRLAQAITEALSAPERAQAMAERGQVLARKLFDVRATARQVLDIYNTITQSRDQAGQDVAT